MSASHGGSEFASHAGSESASNTGPVKEAKSPLLHAWHDPLANIKSNQACVKLVDLNCDGDSKLCICDYDKNLRVYKGTNKLAEYSILETPIAIAITYMDSSLPRIPAIAVAAGSYIFLYRQLRPYRKWNCPPVDIAPAETALWADLKADAISLSSAAKRLTELRDSGSVLTMRSAEFLALEKESAREAFVEDVKDQPFIQNTLITCMEVLKKDSEEADAITLLVVGTESGQLFILPQDPQASQVLCRLQLPSVPALLSVSGCFDVEWRVSILCRDGKLYSAKSGESRNACVLVGGAVDLGAQAVAVCRADKLLWIALMDRTVGCYSARGKRLKSLVVQEDVAELCVLPLRRTKVAHLLLIALSSGEILLCRDTLPLHSFKVEPPIIALAAGVYGREENSVAIVHGFQGALTIKMWRRTADIDNAGAAGALGGPPPEQEVALPVPKKTKLFVELTQRERERCAEVHRAFQRDLCKLRLTTARAYVQTLTDVALTSTGASSTGAGSAQDLRINLQVHGLGPKFQLRVILQNSGNTPFTSLRLVFAFDRRFYQMGFDAQSPQSLAVPLLLPGPRLVFETQVLCVEPNGRAGQLLCLLYRDNHVNALHHPVGGAGPAALTVSATPLLSATVKMPAAEPLL